MRLTEVLKKSFLEGYGSVNIDFSTITWKEKQKICAYFMRKGFAYEDILKKINDIESTEHLT